MSEHNGISESAPSVVPPDAPQFQVAAKNPRRIEALTAILFLISLLAFAGFGVAYGLALNNQVLGGTLGLGFVGFGAAMVLWGKYLTPRGPFEESRPLMATTEAERDELIGDFMVRGKVTFGRRKFIGLLLGMAGAVFAVVATFPLIRSLGPLPKDTFYKTKWKKGSYVSLLDGTRMKVDSLPLGGFATVFPHDDLGGALSQSVLIRVQESGNVVTQPSRADWGPHGYLAYSKVCTHAGCPVGLYEEVSQQLLCPCHQSLFDVLKSAIPVFGPAPRPLPQLPLYVDSEGYLRARRDFIEPIGPGFWYRGGTSTFWYKGKST